MYDSIRKSTIFFPFLVLLAFFSCQQTTTENTIEIHQDSDNGIIEDTPIDKKNPPYYKINFEQRGDLNNDGIPEKIVLYNTGEFTEIVENDSFFVEELIIYTQTNGNWSPIYQYKGDNIFLKDTFLYKNVDGMFTRSFSCYYKDNHLVLEDYTYYGTPEITKKRFYALNEETKLVLRRFEYHSKFSDKVAQFHFDNPNREEVYTFICLDLLDDRYTKEVYWGDMKAELALSHSYTNLKNDCIALPEEVSLGSSINVNERDFEKYEHCLFEDPHDYYLSDINSYTPYTLSELRPYMGLWKNVDFLDTFAQKREFNSLIDDFPIALFGQVEIRKDSILARGSYQDYTLKSEYTWIDKNEIRTTDNNKFLKIKFAPEKNEMTLKLIWGDEVEWEHRYQKNPLVEIDYDNYSPALKQYCLKGKYLDIETKERVLVTGDSIGHWKYQVKDYYSNYMDTKENLLYIDLDALKDEEYPDLSWNSCWNFRGDTLELYSVTNVIPEEGCTIKKNKKIRTLVLESKLF